MWIGPGISAVARRAWLASLDALFPRTCVQCGRLVDGAETRYTCGGCRAGYTPVGEPLCQQCGAPFPGAVAAPGRCADCRAAPPVYRQARSLFLYRGTGARLVHALKYEGGTWLQPEITALLRADPRWAAWFGRAALVPVPLHPRKLRARGYNQAEIVARAVAAAFPDTALALCLQRVRATPSQTLLSRGQRQRNMSGAFACRGQPPGGRPLVLVDDVLTTGATLNAAAAALAQAGWGGISAFTLAHG